MGEFIAKDHAKKKNLPVTISSRGMTDYYSAWGTPANPKGQKVLMREYNIDMSGHGSTLLKANEVEEADAIFVVTSGHIRYITDAVGTEVFENNRLKIRLLGPNVPDP